MSRTCSISAVFPACIRVEETLRTIAAIKACDPAPDEIIVHVDGGNRAITDAIAKAHADVKLIHSDEFVGPGGARNKLVREAQHELVANFDDDSHPEHADYFARVLADFRLFPEMAVLSAASQQSEKDMPGFMQIGILSGCGCVYRKSWFIKTTGHVPLRVAYCMEEVDLSLRLHHLGGRIIHDPDLQVEHLKAVPPRPDPELNARVLANIALMPFLRYPVVLWPLGLWHVLSRVGLAVRRGWWAGLGRGLLLIPAYFATYRSYREPVPVRSVISWFRLRRAPVLLRPRNPPAPVSDAETA